MWKNFQRVDTLKGALEDLFPLFRKMIIALLIQQLILGITFKDPYFLCSLPFLFPFLFFCSLKLFCCKNLPFFYSFSRMSA